MKTNLPKQMLLLILFALSFTSQAQITFATATNYPVGLNPYSITTGDFNNDGKADIATTNANSNNVSILLGSSTGTFSAGSTFAVGSDPFFIISGDFNNDGKTDLATANNNSNNISILLGTGTGSFLPASNYPVGIFPVSLTSADFNGDGNLDIAVSNSGSTNTSILIGSSTGTFSAPNNFGSVHDGFIANGDFNLDSKVDLVIANYAFGNSVTTYSGTGSGTFTGSTTYTISGNNPTSIETKDLNNDGRIDLAVVSPITNNVSVMLGTPSGSFGPVNTFSAGNYAISVVANDFNLDGKRDLAVANFNGNNVSVLLGSGSGTFATALNFGVATNPRQLITADFNGDGRIDIATVNSGSNNVSILLNTSIIPASALNFDGTDDMINIGTSFNTVLAGTNKLTVEAWFKPETNSGNGVIVGNWGNSAASLQYMLRRDGSNVNFFIKNATGLQNVLSTTTISTNNWVHAAGTWDGAVLRVYINSILSGTAAVTGSLQPESNFSSIGGRVGGEFFDGDIDEVRIWNRALCVGEIQNNYNGQISLPQSNLLAYYQFNQGNVALNNSTITSLVALTGPSGTFVSIPLVAGVVSNFVAGTIANTSTVNAYSGPTLSLVGPTVICSGATTTLLASGAVTYTWLPGPTNASISVTPSVTTVYSVVGTVTNGCLSSVKVHTLFVDPIPTVAVNNGTVCSGNSFIIIPSGANSYTIQGGSSIVTPTANSNFTVVGSSSVGCLSSNTATSNVVVNLSPTLTVVSSQTSNLCVGNSATLTASGASNYLWNNSSTTPVITITPSATTTYSVIGAGTNGCQVTATITQQVDPCTGITKYDSKEEIRLSVYPNPTKSVIGVEFLVFNNESYTIEVLNIVGQVLRTEAGSAKHITINTENLQSGVYFIKATVEGKTKTVKVVKE